MANRSQTSLGLALYVHVYGGFDNVFILPATVLLAKTNSVMFFLKAFVKPSQFPRSIDVTPAAELAHSLLIVHINNLYSHVSIDS